MRAGQQVAGLATMDAADQGFLVIEAAQEQQFLAEGQERLQHLAEFHVVPSPLGPPLLAMEAVAGEEAGEPHRRSEPRASALSSPQTGTIPATAGPSSRRGREGRRGGKGDE